MLTAEFKQELYNHFEIQSVELRYQAQNIPFEPAFNRIAEAVTGGINDYHTSTLIQQIVRQLLAYLDQEIARCNSPSRWMRFVKFFWPVLKIFANAR